MMFAIHTKRYLECWSTTANQLAMQCHHIVFNFGHKIMSFLCHSVSTRAVRDHRGGPKPAQEQNDRIIDY